MTSKTLNSTVRRLVVKSQIGFFVVVPNKITSVGKCAEPSSSDVFKDSRKHGKHEGAYSSWYHVSDHWFMAEKCLKDGAKDRTNGLPRPHLGPIFSYNVANTSQRKRSRRPQRTPALTGCPENGVFVASCFTAARRTREKRDK